MTKYLLDTHIAIWAGKRPELVPAHVRELLANAESVYLSSVSVLEISIKSRIGKLDIDASWFLNTAIGAGLKELPVTWAHARAVQALPDIHRDPFDRLLVAQAMDEPLRLVTSNAILAGYSDLVMVV